MGASRLRQRWPWIVGGTGIGLVAIVVLVWFQPQTLFIDERVDQDVPTAQQSATTQPDSETTAPPPRPEPIDLATGEFVSLDHTTTGALRVLDPGDGRRFVRFEGFETSNGPDLFVYLSTNPADGPEGAFDEDYVDLGRLQGNIGDQNYELPADIDLSRYASVVIWCDRFDAAFGAADVTT